MRHSFRWVVKNFHRNIFDGNIFPRSAYDNLDLKLEFRCEIFLRNFVQRIKSITGLCVLKLDSRFKPKPKVGKVVPKTAFFWNAVLRHIPVSDEQNIFIFRKQSFHKNRNVVWIMLPVGINRDSEVKSKFQSFSETDFQRISFASVFG